MRKYENNIVISVIIPTYNNDKTIIEAIQSIVNVEMPVKYEVLVIDDGSVDQTSNLIAEYISQRKDNTIKYFYQKNSGVSAARNVGIKNALGKYVLFLDADDTYSEHVLKEIDEILSTNNDIYVFSYEKLNNKKAIISNKKNIITHYNNKYDFLNAYISGELFGCVSVCSCIFSKESLISNNIFYDSKIAYGEDQWFLINALKVCNDVEFRLELNLLNYTYNTESATNRFNLRRFDAITMLERINQEAFKVNQDIINARINKELVNIATIYTKFNSLQKSIMFVNNVILPKIKTDSDKRLYMFKDMVFTRLPYLYIILYKLYIQLFK
ncbi:glycosyltransferase family 2 protein [Shigella boydii]|uniref:WfeF n=5 Tax=Enterobacteriaceae TaxID=543 RepID=B5L3Z5_SHIBO|nr:glycosyltransferase family 2 protein [Shigella boydii]HAH1209078.1 glycosyltransferase family 2 protein [Escherichia coli]ACD37079.1 WfeF [Shigella boydii]EFX6397684.1 glycosyltransferase family 2 protein [Shigella boydii]EFY9968337.1 glycosyltransferase family 2 protein [Shigella boydii]EFY9988605.1 glycosyltransferase family 2 protein [Shigella boydii]